MVPFRVDGVFVVVIITLNPKPEHPEIQMLEHSRGIVLISQLRG